jgi:hypothetical protein
MYSPADELAVSPFERIIAVPTDDGSVAIERTEIDEMGTEDLLKSGLTWSPPVAGVLGVGGYGAEVNVGELSLSDPTPQLSTLSLSMTSLNPNVAFGDGRLYAKITFGIGAATETILVDWIQGQTIVLPAGKVNIVAVQADAFGHPFILDSNGYAPNLAQTINVPLRLTASLAYGIRPGIFPPTLTQTAGQLFPAAPALYIPPARAKRVLVGDVRGQALSDLQVDLQGAASFNILNLGNAADSVVRTEGVVIPGNDQMQLTSAAGVIGVVICWLLDG